MTLPYGTDLAHVSTLDDVVAEVIRLFAAVSDPTPVRLGDLHNKNEDAPPRIRIIIGEGGELGGPPRISAGYVAGITERATCYIWGDPALAEGDENRAAKALGVRLINAFKRAAAGRLKGAQLTRANATKDAKYGEEYTLLIEYQWGVPEDKAIWRAASTDQTLTPRNPDKPDGDTGKVYHVDVPVIPEARP